MWSYPHRIIAHRCGGVMAPENTWAALHYAKQHHFHAVEFDVMLTKDHIAILMHDPELGRTLSGSGSIADYTYTELLQKDVGVWKASVFANERIPRYEDVLRYCIQNKIWMNVEIKPVPGFDHITAETVVQTTERVLLEFEVDHTQFILFSSFSLTALSVLAQQLPHILRAALFDRIEEKNITIAQELAVVAIHTNHRYLESLQIQHIKQQGYALMCYTVNDVDTARRLFDLGVDAICTDRLDYGFVEN